MTTASAQTQIEQLNSRVTELQNQRTKLEEELRPHRDREHREKQQAEDEKRKAERDAQTISDLQRFEEIVTKHVKDPLLRKPAFEYLCSRSMMSFGPFSPFMLR